MRISNSRIKITVAVHFSIYPPTAGGQMRLFHLYRHLAAFFDIEIITYKHSGKRITRREIYPGLWETCVPKSPEHIATENSISKELGFQATPIALIDHYHLSQEFLRVLRETCETSDIIIASLPFIYSAIRSVTDKDIWLETLDVEYELFASLIPPNVNKQHFLNMIGYAEGEAISNSTLVLTCSPEDKQKLIEYYDKEKQFFVDVPNGVDFEEIDWVKKHGSRQSFNVLTAVFMGSGHPPNKNAVDEIINMAHKLPQYTFLIIGSCGNGYKEKRLPENIKIAGVVSSEEKYSLLLSADFALNPISNGSGTNVKMLEYLGCGLPIISTSVGARGLNLIHGEDLIVCELEAFPTHIQRLAESKELRKSLSAKGEQAARNQYGWDRIALSFYKEIVNRGLAPEVSKENIRAQVESSWDQIKHVKDQHAIDLMSSIALQKKIFIWGAGSSGKNTHSYLQREGINICGYIDGNSTKWHTKVDDKVIYAPHEVMDLNKVFIIIASLFSIEIKTQLEQMGKREDEDFVQQDVELPFLSFV